MPGDEFADLAKANATGCVGIIAGFQNKDSLVAVDPHDCGSYMENKVRLVPNERDLSVSDLLATIEQRPLGSYNEWVVRDYTALGVFSAEPYNVSVQQIPNLPIGARSLYEELEPETAFVPTTIDAVRAAFSTQPVFTFQDSKIMKLSGNGFLDVDHAAIYG